MIIRVPHATIERIKSTRIRTSPVWNPCEAARETLYRVRINKPSNDLRVSRTGGDIPQILGGGGEGGSGIEGVTQGLNDAFR
jgi:hypothetical protein